MESAAWGRRTFASDNYAGVHPEIMQALLDANNGHASSYGNDSYTENATAAFRKIFGEDMEMLERQQSNLTRWPDRKLLMLNIDAGGVQSRRVIDRLLAQEQGTPA